MIPHVAPIRFPEVESGRFLVNPDNPMLKEGVLTGLAAVELAAQVVGAQVGSGAGGGVLVTVEQVEVLGSVVAGSAVQVDVTPLRGSGPLHTARVHVHGLVRLTLSLLLAPA